MAVVLLHGFGENASAWDSQAEALAFDNQVLVPDYSALALPTIEEYADWLRDYLDDRNAPPVALLGHSMGGYIALAFAEKYPDRLTGLGLVHSTATADSAERKQKRLDNVRLITELGTAAFLQNFIPMLYAEAFAEAHPEVLERHFEAVKNLPAEALEAAMLAMRSRPDRLAVLRQVPFPVLFIIGLADRSIPPADVLAQLSLPMHPQQVVLEGVGHSSMTEAPDACLRAIQAFLETTYGE